jgi:hypothetical protein
MWVWVSLFLVIPTRRTGKRNDRPRGFQHQFGNVNVFDIRTQMDLQIAHSMVRVAAWFVVFVVFNVLTGFGVSERHTRPFGTSCVPK